MPTLPVLNLAVHFVRREVRSRYLGSLSGGLWALLQPLIQLAVYGFVWVYVFRMRVPGGEGGPGIVPFLAMGVWPWNAFSESVIRGTMAVQDNAALIGKIALPREILVFSSVASSLLLHALGLGAILVVFWLRGTPLHLLGLPLAAAMFVQLFVLSLGFALLFGAIQVFVRDLGQTLTQIMPLWMFAGPVLYPRDFLPERFQGWLDYNPFTFYPEYLRSVLLGYGSPGTPWLLSLFIALALLALGAFVFRRLSPHFEDFL
jgi:homopolymeric O-antigen transport system permease protein